MYFKGKLHFQPPKVLKIYFKQEISHTHSTAHHHKATSTSAAHIVKSLEQVKPSLAISVYAQLNSQFSHLVNGSEEAATTPCAVVWGGKMFQVLIIANHLTIAIGKM